MNTAIQDTIERTLILKAPQETVWQSLVDPAQLCKWFCHRIEGTLALGQQVVLEWDEDRCPSKIVAFEPISHFAFRWMPGPNPPGVVIGEENTTLVSFYLEHRAWREAQVRGALEDD